VATRVEKQQADTVLYLYGVSTSSPRKLPAVAGVDGSASVETIDCGGIICWISRVPRGDFADNLPKNIENLDWLAPMTQQHQRTVTAIVETTDLLPSRFATIFMSEASLCADMKQRKAALEADLKRIKGSEEWGVKVFAVPPKVERPATVRSGKDYLQAKSALRKARQPAAGGEEIEHFASELEKLSVDMAEGGRISGGRKDLQYHMSLLLRRADRPKLQKVLKRFSAEWEGKRQIECTGPWPPYSFVSRLTE
jgi:hypothetical protein